MAKQLAYTSVPQGLWSGSSGYCTVLCSEGLPRTQADFLERLSVFRIIERDAAGQVMPSAESYPQLEKLNPPNFANIRFQYRGREVSVLLKTSLAGFDYSKRLRKLSHFLVLEEADRAPGGPAWLMVQPGLFLGNWGGTPSLIKDDKVLPTGNLAARPCVTWEKLAGDAGWAGELAASLDSGAPAYIVYQAGMDTASLLLEATALLPVHRRWEATFSTSYLAFPPGVVCNWRFVLYGSPEHLEAQSRRGNFVIDLCGPRIAAPNTPAAAAARAGVPLVGEPAPVATGWSAPAADGSYVPPALPRPVEPQVAPVKTEEYGLQPVPVAVPPPPPGLSGPPLPPRAPLGLDSAANVPPPFLDTRESAVGGSGSSKLMVYLGVTLLLVIGGFVIAAVVNPKLQEQVLALVGQEKKEEEEPKSPKPPAGEVKPVEPKPEPPKPTEPTADVPKEDHSKQEPTESTTPGPHSEPLSSDEPKPATPSPTEQSMPVKEQPEQAAGNDETKSGKKKPKDTQPEKPKNDGPKKKLTRNSQEYAASLGRKVPFFGGEEALVLNRLPTVAPLPTSAESAFCLGDKNKAFAEEDIVKLEKQRLIDYGFVLQIEEDSNAEHPTWNLRFLMPDGNNSEKSFNPPNEPLAKVELRNGQLMFWWTPAYLKWAAEDEQLHPKLVHWSLNAHTLVLGYGGGKSSITYQFFDPPIFRRQEKGVEVDTVLSLNGLEGPTVLLIEPLLPIDKQWIDRVRDKLEFPINSLRPMPVKELGMYKEVGELPYLRCKAAESKSLETATDIGDASSVRFVFDSWFQMRDGADDIATSYDRIKSHKQGMKISKDPPAAGGKTDEEKKKNKERQDYKSNYARWERDNKLHERLSEILKHAESIKYPLRLVAKISQADDQTTIVIAGFRPEGK